MENKNKLEKRRLVKLNFDDELRDLQNGEIRYALNCRVGNSDNNNQGDIENTKGNVLVSFNLPSGINKCIGAKEDLANKRIFYFIYNSLGNHGIYEYAESTNNITLLLQGSFLNFKTNYLITGINVVGNLLYWTDDLNEPMKLDVEKAKLPFSAGGYPTPFLIDYIYAIKPPQPCEPTIVYGSDKNVNTNLLKQKLFQFKARYVYDNNEYSVTSPISIVALPSSGCGSQTFIDNHIKITVETGNAIVKAIEIFAREVSDITLSQATDFYTITELNKKEIGIADNTTYTYSFYNDKNYIALDPIRSNQLQDFVPLKAKAQELVDGNRLVYGNIEEGFDPVDIKAKINVAFEESVVIKTLTIKGRVFISNPFARDIHFAYKQPIYIDDPNLPPLWGGYDRQKSGFGTPKYVYFPSVFDYTQTLVLGGFVAYLAGTNYYDITKQNVPSGISANSIGVYQADTISRKNDISNAIMQDKGIYSTYSIGDVSEGSYILRFASHLLSSNDLSDSSLSWQRTSTRTTVVGGKQGHEIAIEFKIDANGNYYVLVDGIDMSVSVNANNGVLDLQKLGNQYSGDTYIFDLTAPEYQSLGSDTSNSSVAEGYCCDKDLGTATGSAMLPDTRIHLAELELESFVLPPNNLMLNKSFVTNNWIKQKTYTDHNGYFFVAANRTFISNLNPKVLGRTGNNFNFINQGQTFYEGNNPVSVFDFTQDKSFIYYLQNQTLIAGVQQLSRTVVTGKVTDNNGNPISGFNVQITRGGSAKTNYDGDFSIYAYGNHVLSQGYIRNDFACYSLTGGNCFGVLSALSSPVNFTLSGVNNLPYNAASSLYYYVIAGTATTITFTNLPSVSLKRGATYEYGIVYYDHGLRNGTTQTKDYLYNDIAHNYGLKLYVPFYTDTRPNTNIIYDSGKPVISWAIANTPPDWATHYQWVRTKRGSISNYIQWTIQNVTYVDDTGSTTPFVNATQVKLNFASIVGTTTLGYKQRNSNSVLTYQFAEGDRIRFIKQNTGVYFPQYYDLEIKSADTVNTLLLTIPNGTGGIQLNPGDLIEIYRPQFGNISVEEDIFYEIGECYEIGNAGLPTRYHKKGKAVSNTAQGLLFHHQDQDTSKTWKYTSVSKQQFTNLLILQGNTPHSYTKGDQIIIEQSNGYNSSLSTTAIVLSVPNNLQIVVTVFYQAAFATSTNTSTGTIYKPATGIYSTGDTYYKLRNIPFNASNTGANSINIKFWYIEAENYSDFWTSTYYSIGRPNKVDKQFKQIRRPTTIYYSGQYIPETNINDLNNILDTDFETYERTYGSIQRFNNINRMLDCYQELKVGRIPISQKIWKDTTGSSVVAVSDSVLNPIDYYAGEYGIGRNPESLSVYGYRRYFLDANRGVFCRLSTDGITPISEHNFKAHNFFTDECKILTALGVPFHVYTVYDQKFTECVVAFEDVFPGGESIAYNGKTISFNEDENTWASFYSYKPDFMVSNDTDIITFKNGELWKHNENSVYNNFYGVQYNSQVWFPVNGEPSKEKVFQAISFEDADAWDVIAECPNGMTTTLSAADFETIKNMRYSPIWNDINSPNIYNVPNFNGKVMGQKMQDYVMLVKLISTQKTFQKLYAVNVLWTPAERSNK